MNNDNDEPIDALIVRLNDRNKRINYLKKMLIIEENSFHALVDKLIKQLENKND